MKYLVRLAKEKPERFEREWEKRLSSWLELIREDAGRLKNRKGETTPPVFDRVEEAMAILKACEGGVRR